MTTQNDFAELMRAHKNQITESSIKGYMVEAGRRSGIPRDRICDMIEEMKYLLKCMSPEDASKAFEKFEKDI